MRVTNKTADSLTVTWTAGYDGGEDQWFHVSYLKTNSEDEETFSDSITGGDNMYTVAGLEEYTDYDIRVYAENRIGRNPDYGKITEKTLRKYQLSHITFKICICWSNVPTCMPVFECFYWHN